MLKLVKCVVSGVGGPDRNFFGTTIQRHLETQARIDLRIDWSGGDNGTANVKVVVDCCEFTFGKVKAAIDEALQGTYLASPLIAPKHEPATALAA